MTTETTATTESTEVTKAIIDEHFAKANSYCAHTNILLITEHLADQYRALATSKDANATLRRRMQELVDVVTEFVKDNLDSGASKSDLIELANELDIELTKSVTVTFKVQYQADLTVPIDFNEDEIDSSDFDVEISFNNNDLDIEFDNDSHDIDDFEVEIN